MLSTSWVISTAHDVSLFWTQGWFRVKSPSLRAEKIHVIVVEWQTRWLEVPVLLKGRGGSSPLGDTVANAARDYNRQTGTRKSLRVRVPLNLPSRLVVER